MGGRSRRKNWRERMYDDLKEYVSEKSENGNPKFDKNELKIALGIEHDQGGHYWFCIQGYLEQWRQDAIDFLGESLVNGHFSDLLDKHNGNKDEALSDLYAEMWQKQIFGYYYERENQQYVPITFSHWQQVKNRRIVALSKEDEKIGVMNNQLKAGGLPEFIAIGKKKDDIASLPAGEE